MTEIIPLKKETILIFGGAGFIGASLVDLASRSGYNVICASRSASGSSVLGGRRNIEYVRADVNDEESYAHLLKVVSHIFYLVSATTPRTSTEDATVDIDANLLPFVRFLKANAAANNVPITFASSGGTVYGRSAYLPMNEAHATDPICPYGIVKLAMEKYLAYYGTKYRFRYTILRLANPYGGKFHRRSDQGVIDVFARKIKHGEPLVVWGRGGVVRDYVHIDDVCEAFMLAMDYTGTHHVFNIGSGIGHSILDIIETFAAHSERPPALTLEPARDFDIPQNILDIKLAASELKWVPKIDFNAGVAETLRNLK